MTSEVERRNLEWYRSLPVMTFASVAKIKALPEYSATSPTGVAVGKTWRRLNGDFDASFKAHGGIPKWVICRYEEAEDEYVRTDWLLTRDGYAKNIRDCTLEENKASRAMFTRQQMCKTVIYRPVVRVRMHVFDPCKRCDMPDLCNAEGHCDQSYNGYR